MPFLLDTMPSAPIIIPITVLVVVVVFIVLLVAHILRKLVGCPHKKSKYPFQNQDPSKIKSVLPTSPYTIDPSSTASSNSIYFVKGHSSGGHLLYPALASAPSRSPSGRHDDSFERNSSAQEQTYSLDQVDSAIEEHLLGSEGSPSSALTHSQEGHSLIARSSSASPNLPAGIPYEVDERTTFRQEISYHRAEHTEFIGAYNNGAEQHYESDV